MKIAIAGYGAEGESNYRYWNTPDNQVVIVDERQPERELPVDASVIVGEGAFERLEGFDIVVRTAGLAPYKIKTDGNIWSATNEFFARCTTPVIGVTGSKGKGTTCSLIVSILRAAGKKVELVGNIGVPALDALEAANQADVVVYELSSFQLWDVKRTPDVSVLLMVEPDHLDVHVDMDDYLRAKANIIDVSGKSKLIYNPHSRYTIGMVKQALGEKMSAAATYGDEVSSRIYAKAGRFYDNGREICSTNELRLPGEHNIENACAAIAAALEFIDDYTAVRQGLNDFTGLPHRLKFVREINDIRYYDDSIATTPGSAIAALQAFSAPKVMILGGSSKGADFTELAQVAAGAKVRAAVLIGDEADTLQAALEPLDVTCVNLGDDVTMRQVVEVATKQAEEGDVVILSPSCASFGMFKNYADRGQQFVDAVESL
jgi:UDP-N-acetylmuramoylalanine--D-glutamate ligase